MDTTCRIDVDSMSILRQYSEFLRHFILQSPVSMKLLESYSLQLCKEKRPPDRFLGIPRTSTFRYLNVFITMTLLLYKSVNHC